VHVLEVVGVLVPVDAGVEDVGVAGEQLLDVRG